MIAVTCGCGCERADRRGFESTSVRGVYIGRGAGYHLVKRRLGWDVIDERGRSLYFRATVLPRTLDEANKAATVHARGAGHGNP